MKVNGLMFRRKNASPLQRLLFLRRGVPARVSVCRLFFAAVTAAGAAAVISNSKHSKKRACQNAFRVSVGIDRA
jgi:hypothetical protein